MTQSYLLRFFHGNEESTFKGQTQSFFYKSSSELRPAPYWLHQSPLQYIRFHQSQSGSPSVHGVHYSPSGSIRVQYSA